MMAFIFAGSGAPVCEQRRNLAKIAGSKHAWRENA
jgi:hypothetical protein